MHSACAFLNTDGGWLIFGIAPKSLKILGQEVTDSTQQEIAKAITGLEPAVDVKIHYVDVPDRPGNKVIAMHFDGWVWGERPHTFHGCPGLLLCANFGPESKGLGTKKPQNYLIVCGFFALQSDSCR